MALGRKTGGRKKGTPNKQTGLLKDAILEGAKRAGGKEGMVGYLKKQAIANPAAYLALLGRVLPQQVQQSIEASDPIKVLMTDVASQGRRIFDRAVGTEPVPSVEPTEEKPADQGTRH